MKNKIKKILIFRFGAIGDVIHSTALFRALKTSDPELSIHYLTSKIPSMLIENDPDLDKVWIVEGKSYKYLVKLADILRKERFDVCINLQPSIRTRIFSFLINAKQNLTYKKSFKLHAVENFWKTAQFLFKDIKLESELKIYLPEEIKKKISNLIDKDDKVIGFIMGVSSIRQGRRWPVGHWRKLAKGIIDKYNCKIALIGSKDDIELSQKLLDISPDIISFCGKLDIAESAALLARCNIVISGDTGPLHLATAVGTSVIGLYGAAPISRTGPYGNKLKCITVNSGRDCVPCNKRQCKLIKKGELYTPCLVDITPEEILNLIFI